MYSSPASIFTVNAVPPGPDLFITAFRDELMDAGPIQTSTICLACRQGENGGNRQVPNSEVILNITLVNNLEFVSIFYSSDAMRCICSHRHNPDTPRHTRRHPNIDTEPKTDTLWLCLMSEGGEGATRAWLKWGVKGGREGGRQLPVPSASDAPSPSKAALPNSQQVTLSFQKAENGESLNFDT